MHPTSTWVLLLLTVMFVVAVHVSLFSWLWSTTAYGGSVFGAWRDGNLQVVAILLGGQPLYWPDRDGTAAQCAFYAAVLTPFAHWFVFSWWAWTRIARSAGEPPWVGRMAAIPVFGLLGQWLMVMRLPEIGQSRP